jgi:hypothetical protein
MAAEAAEEATAEVEAEAEVLSAPALTESLARARRVKPA